jgi:PAS domain-containing protein
MMLLFPHTVVLLVGCALGTTAAFLGWRQRNKTGGWLFVALMLACAVWTGAAAVESAVVGVEVKILWSKIEYIGLCYVSVLLLAFVLSYTHQLRMVRKNAQILLALIPTCSLALVWTNEWHSLLWTGFVPGAGDENILFYCRGPLFWAIAGYTYFFTACAFVVLAQTCRSAEQDLRRQYYAFMVSMVFPLGSGLIYLVGQKWVGGLDVAPLGFSVSALVIAWTILHFRLLDLVPIGRAVLVERMPDGMVVFDAIGRLVDINPAARRLLGTGVHDAQHVVEILPGLLPLLSAVNDTQIDFTFKDGTRHVSARVVPMLDKRGELQGRLFILHDITDRVLAMLEREHMAESLHQADKQINALRSLLPICCSCKRIRNDDGYWQQLESYIREHTEYEFSHGLCPECEKKYYAEFGIIPQPSQPERSP